MTRSDGPFLPYGRQTVDDDDVAAVIDVLRGDRLTQGPAVEAFEAALAKTVGAARAVASANGTAALYIACRALLPPGERPAPGDAAIVPAVTFLATAAAPRLAGYDVVLCDVDPDTGLMRPEDALEAAARVQSAGGRVRLMLPVHLAGQTVDMDKAADVADAVGAVVIEDACHALGTEHQAGGAWGAVGACRRSAMTAFSFHPVKTIAAGEGGATTVNDPRLADRLALLRNHAMERNPAGWRNEAPGSWWYECAEPSFNFRLSDIHAALGLSQLGKLSRFVSRRRALRDAYAAALAPLAPWAVPVPAVPHCRPGWHLFSVLIDFASLGVTRETATQALSAAGIGSQVHYIPLHLQPCWREAAAGLRLPGAEAYYARTLSLPLFPAMEDRDIRRVVAALAAALGLPPPPPN